MQIFFILTILILSACTPSPESIQRAIEQTQAVASTPTESAPGGCTHWSEITAIDALKAGDQCVYGDLYDQQNLEDENGATFVVLRFSSATDAFYVLQIFDVPARRGDCITVVGAVKRDMNGVPYMSVDSAVDTC